MLVLFQKTLSKLAHSKSVQCPKFILLEECKYFLEDFLKGILLSRFIRMLLAPLQRLFALSPLGTDQSLILLTPFIN